MMKLSSWRLTVAILAAATIILVAGGLSIASNMGFKLNTPIVISTGVGQIGANWTSIPYNNPYGSAGGFCVQTGLVSTGLVGKGSITVLNETNGLASTVTCGSPGASSLALIPGKRIQIKQPLNPIGTAPT